MRGGLTSVLIQAAAQRQPGPWSLTPDLASLCSTAGRKFYTSLGRHVPTHGPDARQDRPEGRARPWGTSTSICSSQPPAALTQRIEFRTVAPPAGRYFFFLPVIEPKMAKSARCHPTVLGHPTPRKVGRYSECPRVWRA
jgi:hypothetical protein